MVIVKKKKKKKKRVLIYDIDLLFLLEMQLAQRKYNFYIVIIICLIYSEYNSLYNNKGIF